MLYGMKKIGILAAVSGWGIVIVLGMCGCGPSQTQRLEQAMASFDAAPEKSLKVIAAFAEDINHYPKASCRQRAIELCEKKLREHYICSDQTAHEDLPILKALIRDNTAFRCLDQAALADECEKVYQQQLEILREIRKYTADHVRIMDFVTIRLRMEKAHIRDNEVYLQLDQLVKLFCNDQETARDFFAGKLVWKKSEFSTPCHVCDGRGRRPCIICHDTGICRRCKGNGWYWGNARSSFVKHNKSRNVYRTSSDGTKIRLYRRPMNYDSSDVSISRVQVACSPQCTACNGQQAPCKLCGPWGAVLQKKKILIQFQHQRLKLISWLDTQCGESSGTSAEAATAAPVEAGKQPAPAAAAK